MPDQPAASTDDMQRLILTDPGNVAAIVRHAEALYLGGRFEGARPWLRRAGRIAPGAGFVLHSSALAARRSGDLGRAVRLFRAESALDPRAWKAVSRMADDLDALGRWEEAGPAYRWLRALGVTGADLDTRIATAGLRGATAWGGVTRVIDALTGSAAGDPAVVAALWDAADRLPGTGAAHRAWCRLADRAGDTAELPTSVAVARLASLDTEAAITSWNGRPAAWRRAAWQTVQRHAPRLRPLADGALAASVAGPAGTLRDALRGAGLVAVDIGARGLPLGDAPLLPAVGTVVAIDADVEATGAISAAFADVAGWHDLRPVTAAVGESAEARRLNVTRQPGLSSLLEPDPAVAAACGMADDMEVVRTRAVRTMPLAAVLEPLGLPPPAHLKLDTQGTELEVLRGADALLRDHVLSVQVEAEFRAIYRGQPLFGDVDRFLVERGFETVLLRRNRRRLGAPRAEVPSRLEIGWCHALYMRRIPDLLDREPDWRQVTRYCLIAMAYRLADRALMLLGHPAVTGRHPQAAAMADALRGLARAWPDQVDDSEGRGYRKDRW